MDKDQLEEIDSAEDAAPAEMPEEGKKNVFNKVKKKSLEKRKKSVAGKYYCILWRYTTNLINSFALKGEDVDETAPEETDGAEDAGPAEIPEEGKQN